MKKSILISNTFLFFLLILTNSCNEEILDEPKPTSSVTGEVVYNSREGVDAYLSGILRRFRNQFERTDTGGLYSIYFARTVKGNDLIQKPTWFLYDYAHQNRSATYRRVNFTWNYCFNLISNANTLIKGVNESDLSEKDKNETSAQALALRAFYYFQLAMEFQHTYNHDSSLPSLPIYTEPASGGKPLSTLKEVYELIVEDLTKARDISSDSRIDKSFINKSVINGILARVYLVMGNWSGAETAAKAAQEGYSLSPSTYKNGFDDLSNSEWLWGMPQFSDQTAYYYSAPSAFTDHNVGSYKGTFVNSEFVKMFSKTDVRNQFKNIYGLKDEDDYRYYVTDKFKFKFDSDIVIMRLPEMLLIEAEAKARQGKDVESAKILFDLQKNRDPEAKASGNSGNQLIEEILVERRKELYAEMGVEWFDAKRLQRGIKRTGNHRVMLELTPNDKRFILKIPQKEIDANKNIDESVNANR